MHAGMHAGMHGSDCHSRWRQKRRGATGPPYRGTSQVWCASNLRVEKAAKRQARSPDLVQAIWKRARMLTSHPLSSLCQTSVKHRLPAWVRHKVERHEISGKKTEADV